MDLSFSILLNLTHILNMLLLTDELIKVSLLRHECRLSFCIFQSADELSKPDANGYTLVKMNVQHVQNFLMTKQHASISTIAYLIQRQEYVLSKFEGAVHKKYYKLGCCET